MYNLQIGLFVQNLESSFVSRQYAALLLDATLEGGKWELSKDLVRFFRAIGKTIYFLSLWSEISLVLLWDLNCRKDFAVVDLYRG